LQHDDITSEASAGLLAALTTIVSRAAAAILAARDGALDTRTKPDRSPVTAADDASETVIIEGLAGVLPGIPIVSEEASGRVRPQLHGDRFILVDPLDGTRELVAGRDEFCVNLAVVSGGRARLGIIAAPALGLIWRTAAGGGAERLRLAPGAPASAASEHTPIRPRPWPPTGAAAAVSRSHLDPQTEAFLSSLPQAERLASGSAIKLCRIAEGAADVYPRLSPVCEWDVAAGDAIVSAAGGMVTAPDGKPLAYGRPDAGFIVPGFVAWGDRSAPQRLLRSP
jgi:3'(2'), 5'-bisphosphate nucleotidase